MAQQKHKVSVMYSLERFVVSFIELIVLSLSIPGAIASTLDVVQAIRKYIRKFKRKPKAR